MTYDWDEADNRRQDREYEKRMAFRPSPEAEAAAVWAVLDAPARERPHRIAAAMAAHGLAVAAAAATRLAELVEATGDATAVRAALAELADAAQDDWDGVEREVEDRGYRARSPASLARIAEEILRLRVARAISEALNDDEWRAELGAALVA